MNNREPKRNIQFLQREEEDINKAIELSLLEEERKRKEDEDRFKKECNAAKQQSLLTYVQSSVFGKTNFNPPLGPNVSNNNNSSSNFNPPIKNISNSSHSTVKSNSFFSVENELDIPEDLICPITKELFKEPVVAPDGNTYEKAAIVKWLAAHHCSPLRPDLKINGSPEKILYRNLIVENLVAKILEASPHIYPERQPKVNNIHKKI